VVVASVAQRSGCFDRDAGGTGAGARLDADLDVVAEGGERALETLVEGARTADFLRE